MSLQDIELLVGKIDQAINIIKNLKDDNKKLSEKYNIINSKLQLLEKENADLKNSLYSKENEITKTNALHEKLELKVQEILKYLPENDAVQKSDDVKQEIIPAENLKNIDEPEGELIKDFVQNSVKSEKKSLFSDFNSSNDNISASVKQQTENDIDIMDEDIDIIEEELGFDDKNELKKGAVTLTGEIIDKSETETDNITEDLDDETLLSEKNFDSDIGNAELVSKDEKDIDFYFDVVDPSDNEDLPKGVL